MKEVLKIQWVATGLMLLLTGSISITAMAISSSNTSNPDKTSKLRNSKNVPNEVELAQLEFKGAKLIDAIRIMSELSGVNIVATQEAMDIEVTMYLQNVTVREAIDTLCKINGLWYREDPTTRSFRIMTSKEFQNDLVVYRDDETRVFTLLNPNVIDVAEAISSLYGDRVILSLGREVDSDSNRSSNSGSGSSNSASDGFSNSGSNRRSNNGNANSDDTRNSGSSRGGQGRNGSKKVNDELTIDQLSNLSQRGMKNNQVNNMALQSISRQESPIFVTVNNEHNLVLIRTSDRRVMKDIATLVQELDRPVPQVLLEMRILDVSLGDEFQSVFDYQLTGGTSQITEKNEAGISLTDVTKNALGLGNFDNEGGTFIYQFLNNSLKTSIQMLDKNNQVEVLSAPMILASNHRPAEIVVGEERVMVTGVTTQNVETSAGRSSTFISAETEIRSIGNILKITPVVNADRTIILDLEQTNSSVNIAGAFIPVISEAGRVTSFAVDTVNTATIRGKIIAKDNLTIAVGGLIRRSKSTGVSKVPLLGDIPFLGRLFRKEFEKESKSELILLITPHVLMTPSEAEAYTHKHTTSL
ncbi:MAG: hypothetical protein KUG82_18690 [Pseudomonadales bacterium]|nr:hypothetical protein [Pseudomonadales bacterium]